MAFQGALTNTSLTEGEVLRYEIQWLMTASRPVYLNGHYYVFPVLGQLGRGIRLGCFYRGHARPVGRDAVDIFAPRYTVVVALIDGEVIRARDIGGGEAEVILLGADGQEYYHTHMRAGSQARFGIETGMMVSVGQPIGQIGGGGHGHLHISVTDPDCNNEYPDCGYERINDDGSTTIFHCRTDRHAGNRIRELLPEILSLKGALPAPPGSLRGCPSCRVRIPIQDNNP